MNFKKNVKPHKSADVYYDLFEGNMDPADFLEDGLDLQTIRFAIQNIDKFLIEMENRNGGARRGEWAT